MLNPFPKDTGVEKQTDLRENVGRRWVLEREALDLGFWKEKRWKSDVEEDCYELIYAQFAQVQVVMLYCHTQ